MKSVKENFEYNKEDNHWIDFPYVISKEEFVQIDWMQFEPNYDKLCKRKREIEKKSINAILNYARTINFFTDEEFEDLKFGIFDIQLNLNDSQISGYIVSYGVDEDGSSKIPWKDVYGVWKVFFEGNTIVQVQRE